MQAPRVEIKTSMGTFVVEIYESHVPKTAKNFIELARRGYYDGTIVSAPPLPTLCPTGWFPCRKSWPTLLVLMQTNNISFCSSIVLLGTS